MQWTLDQLRQFILTAESGSFSAAARQQGKAQSAVSTAIALLEADLGVQLFDRRQRNAQLSEAGRVLLLEARHVLQQAQALDTRAQALSAGQQASLSLALDEALPYTAISALTSELSAQFPQLELTLLHGTATEICTQVKDQRAQVGVHFVRDALPAHFEQVHLGFVPQGVFVVQGHPLLDLPSVGTEDLAAYRQLIMAVEDIEDTAYSPRLWRSDSFYSIAEMVADILGWAILPVNIGKYLAYRQALQQLHCPVLKLSPLSVRMLWRQGWQTPDTVQWIQKRFAQLLEHIKQT